MGIRASRQVFHAGASSISLRKPEFRSNRTKSKGRGTFACETIGYGCFPEDAVITKDPTKNKDGSVIAAIGERSPRPLRFHMKRMAEIEPTNRAAARTGPWFGWKKQKPMDAGERKGPRRSRVILEDPAWTRRHLRSGFARQHLVEAKSSTGKDGQHPLSVAVESFPGYSSGGG